MATTAFTVEHINLSMRDFCSKIPGYEDPTGYNKDDPSTWPGYLTSNVYTLAGVTDANGNPKKMSIGQLVMAVCLSRATELEAKIVAEMVEMAQTTADLEKFSKIEADLAAWQKAFPSTTLNATLKEDGTPTTAFNIDSEDYPNLYAILSDKDERETFLSDIGMDRSATTWSADGVDEMMQAVEELMDSKNTISQEQLIDIQSLTSKRDDTYSLISNVLKSLYTVMTGNVNNI